jgi:hypothetical protein
VRVRASSRLPVALAAIERIRGVQSRPADRGSDD